MVIAFGARRNATTNGGDASRVGALRQRLTDRHVISAVCEPLFMAFSPITRDEAAEKCSDARRVAPIRASVWW